MLYEPVQAVFFFGFVDGFADAVAIESKPRT